MRPAVVEYNDNKGAAMRKVFEETRKILAVEKGQLQKEGPRRGGSKARYLTRTENPRSVV